MLDRLSAPECDATLTADEMLARPMKSAAQFPGLGIRLTLCAFGASLAVVLPAAASDVLPIFDAHLHYNDEATAVYPVPDVLERFRDSGVTAILATSRPNDGTQALVSAARTEPRAAPRVVPFVRPYRTRADVGTWFNDPEIYSLIESELRRYPGYRGIGEFHVYGADAGSIWVKRMVALAVDRNLWLHAHCDEATLEILFGHDPRVKIIWAHTGFTTPPERIARYMDRYPGLVGELSFRHDVSDGGKVAPAWRALFLAYPDRFVVGSDTWVNERWDQYPEIIAQYRRWLRDLPPDVAAKIASGNGERLFAAAPDR
ncbi:MAG TPA: amidohydrolase family protein [Casimicrobiaceae bacterium]|nr:amidohydrolase family protein [Casimicrobiaceae bacterium]